jgi:FolB domain-containing protein
MNPSDTIEIRKLRVTTHIGVPDEERAKPQELLLSVVMTPSSGFDDLDDDIAWTVDYYAVAQELQALAAERPRCLIETLATDCASHLLEKHPLRRVDILVEKFVLPDTECVAVRVVREKN